MGGDRCIKRQFVNRFKREVAYSIAQFAGLNVLKRDLRIRLTDVTATVASLVVREFDEGERGCLVPSYRM